MDSVKGNIVIVDDLPENLRLLAGILTAKGYKARPAQSGTRALATIEKEIPDLVLLDIMMPDMNGYDVCKTLKENELTRDIPVIFLSALDETIDKVKAFQAGGVDYIVKPFQSEEVHVRIQNQLMIQSQKKQLVKEIRHREETEKQLVKSQGLLKSVLNSSTDGIMAFSPLRNEKNNRIQDFKLLVANPVARAHFIKPDHDSTSYLFSICFPDFFESPVFHSLVNVVEDNKLFSKEVFFENSKIKAWFQIIAVHLEDGFAITLRDITERKTLETHLQKQAHIDSLTGLANRRHFDSCIQTEWKKSIRGKLPITLIFIDVDFFKKYNDTYGHQMGDECLIKLSKAFINTVNRPGDIMTRYGGEEFIAVLPATDIKGGVHIAQSIQKQVRDLKIDHHTSDVSRFISVSMGIVSMVPDRSHKIDRFIKAADRSLYRAKQKGRNRFDISDNHM